MKVQFQGALSTGRRTTHTSYTKCISHDGIQPVDLRDIVAPLHGTHMRTHSDHGTKTMIDTHVVM
jgi:hypothetical protein